MMQTDFATMLHNADYTPQPLLFTSEYLLGRRGDVNAGTDLYIRSPVGASIRSVTKGTEHC